VLVCVHIMRRLYSYGARIEAFVGQEPEETLTYILFC